MTTDQEHERLRDAVVEAAMAYRDEGLAGSHLRGEKLDWAISDLRAYHAESPAHNPVPRCVPPKGDTYGRNQHWLTTDLSDDAVVATWDLVGSWIFPSGGEMSPEQVAANGWRYHSVASPAQVDTGIPPTDEAIEQFWKSHYRAHGPMTIVEGVKACLAHFTAPARIEPTIAAVRELLVKCGYSDTGENERLVFAALAHFSPTQAPTCANSAQVAQPAPVQQEITDEEIEAIWAELGVGSLHGFGATIVMMRKFARTLLAKHSSVSIPKTIPTQLWNLSKTEAKDQFINDAEAVLKAAGVEVRG